MSENTAHDIITNNILYSFLNSAALINDGDTIGTDGSMARSWPYLHHAAGGGLQDGATHPTALELHHPPQHRPRHADQLHHPSGARMDRAVGRFTIPAGSMVVGCFVAVVVSLGLFDSLLLRL